MQTNNSILHNPNTNILINFICNLFNNFSMKQCRALNCQREDLLRKDAVSVHKNCRLCAKHFQDSCFRNHSRNRLGKMAVPTRFSYKLGIKRKLFRDETSGMWHLTNHTMTILTYCYWLVITNTIFQIVYGQQSPFRNIQLKPMSHCHHPLWKVHYQIYPNIMSFEIYKDFQTIKTIHFQLFCCR